MAGTGLKIAALPAGVVAAVLTVEALVSKDARLARLSSRLSVQILILAVRAATPAALLLTCRNVARLIQSPGAFNVRRLLWWSLSVWSVAEVGFLLYIWNNMRRLNAQTMRRWQAVTTHSTEEKRKASMERYLLALAQVCTGGRSDEGRGVAKKASRRPAPSKLEPPLDSEEVERPAKRYISAGLLTNLSSTNLLGLSPTHEASVEDLLKCMEGTDNVLEGDVERLKLTELASFYRGSGRGETNEITSWLKQGNVQEWVAHYWFRGSTPEELQAQRPKEYQELKRLVNMVLESSGIANLPEGRNPHVRCYRLMTDPLPVLHRPLAVYATTSLLCPLLTSWVMQRLGFQHERIGGLCYWHRQPRAGVKADVDIAGPRKVPVVMVHGLGVGLVPYYLFVHRLSERHSAHLYVPEFPFLAMAPWESVPSAREIVAQLQDMLAANGHTAAHFVGHSFGAIVIGWMMKMSPSSVVYATLLDPAHFLLIKADVICKVIFGNPKTPFEMIVRYFGFRELFTVNLLCRNFFWEQSTMWPEDIHVPVVIQLASDDHIVASIFVRRLLEHERAARRQRRRGQRRLSQSQNYGSALDVREEALRQRGQRTEPIDIQWCEGFYHGEILVHGHASEKLFGKMKQMVMDAHGEPRA